MKDDEQLIQETAKGSDVALAKLYERYGQNVYNISISYTQHVEDAEEVTQDVFLKIFHSAKEFRFDSALSSWIYRITVNKSLDFLRKKNAKKRKAFFTSLYKRNSAELKVDNADFVHPGVILEQKENARYLFKALDTLPNNQKTAFILREIEGLSYQKISEVMKMTNKAVESVLYRAKANLRKGLEQYYRE